MLAPLLALAPAAVQSHATHTQLMHMGDAQVDSFNKHASGKSGNKLIARLPNKLFGSKKSPRDRDPKTPSPSSGGLAPSPSGNSITLDEMLVYQNVSLQQPSLNAALYCYHFLPINCTSLPAPMHLVCSCVQC